MQAKPITIKDILVATDPAARHPMPWGKSEVLIRGITLREYLRLLAVHPTLSELIDPTEKWDNTEELVSVVGIPALAALASLGSDLPTKSIVKYGPAAVAHVFLSVAELTFVMRDPDDLFESTRKKGSSAPPRQKSEDEPPEVVKKDSRLIHTVQCAAEYTARTGRDGFDLTPACIAFHARFFADLDRSNRIQMFNAIAAAMGDKKAHEILGAV